MSTTDQFLLALQAYQESQAELRQSEGRLPVAAEISTKDGFLFKGILRTQ